MLLDPPVWRGLSIRDYSSWAHQIWHILALRTTRRFVEPCYAIILMKLLSDFRCLQRTISDVPRISPPSEASRVIRRERLSFQRWMGWYVDYPGVAVPDVAFESENFVSSHP